MSHLLNGTDGASPSRGSRRKTPADLLWDRLENRRRRAASKDPVWASIQQRRGDGSDGFLSVVSEGLTWADWNEQRRIELELVPDPRWVPVLRWFGEHTLSSLRRSIRHAYQRVNRGWDDTEVWSLDSSLCRRLAEQLDHLADISHGWPGPDEQAPTFEAWIELLRSKAVDLRRYDGTPESEALSETWMKLTSDRNADPTDVEAARGAMRAREDADRAAAKSALTWVVTNLETLWD